MDYKYMHSDFQLEGKKMNQTELLLYAENLKQHHHSFFSDFGAFILEWFNDKDYVQLTTSGTTGTPKQIKLLKQAMVNSAIATGKHFNLQAKQTALLCLPTKYIAGKLMFIRALILGLHLDVVLPNSNPMQNIEKAYDFVAMVPMQVLHSIEKLDLIKILIVGGAKLDLKVKELLKHTKCKVYETYGMTETVTHIATKLIFEEAFTTLPHAKIEIDERGCLVIEAPSVNPERLVTNDLVDFIAPNKFKWLGRFDNVINSGGIKLFPEQIEEKLVTKIPHRFFVIGKEDEILGNKLVLVIESLPYQIDESIFNDLNKFEKPKEIQFVSKFEETATGKILRKENLK